jgi:hypothetical protein
MLAAFVLSAGFAFSLKDDLDCRVALRAPRNDIDTPRAQRVLG